ncbi:glucocorticoid receptor isoform X2 [Myripristis murdjan]|uniref:glucocorticoid receptor isoform X2 n=1 Tax=Myripristis murdjan TaxID=586833 RepID=UPI001175DAED|nr:glucocorticoid receptor isoform X2 [Myripristis murdjan]
MTGNYVGNLNCLKMHYFKDQEMDQGGLKHSSNRDDSLTFGETGDQVGGETGDAVGSLHPSTMHLPNCGSQPQPREAPNKLGGTKTQGELGGLIEPSHQRVIGEGLNMKEGKIIRMQKQPQQQQQQRDTGSFNMEDNLSFLEQSISDLDCTSTSVISTSDTSVLVNLPLPDLFPQHVKQEVDFSLDKDLGTYSGHTGHGSCDLDSNNSRLIEESDIWRDLDLPGSLPDISDFELDTEVAHLDNVLHDSGSGTVSSMLKETKSFSGNGGNCTNMNGTDQQQHPVHHHHQQQHHLLHHQQHQLHQQQQQQPPPLLSSVMIKEEKDADDSFVHIRTPGVVKQEKQDGASYCQSSCLQNSLSSLHGGGPMSSSMGVGGGPGYHYRANPSSAVGLPDQKPFGMYSNLSPLGEGWVRGNGYGESSGIQRGNDGLPSASALTTFSVSFPSSSARTGESSSSVVPGQTKPSGPTHKICLVCSDEASGCHYGVVTCGSCKVFFKRAVEGQHNYLCAGRNDCIIDKIRRKNCPACRFRKCLQAGMNLEARKNKKLIKMKVQQSSVSSEQGGSMPLPVIPKSMPQLVPTMLSLLKAIEPEIIYSGYDSTLPDTSSRLMTTLNRLGGQQVISAVKWAKSLPGFRNLHLDDQMTLLQCSWLFLMSFSLGWRSYEQCNGSMLCFAPDLVINEERMKLPFMTDQCEQMLKISNEFVRLQVSYDEYLCMKVLLLLSTVPKDGLKSQAVFDEIRMTYIKELGKAIVKREENSSQNWQRFYQLTKLLDSMQEMVEGLLQICFYTFVNKTLSVEFPEMLAEIITNQIPKFKDGSVKPLLFHQK